MPKRSRSKKAPKDINSLAYFIVEQSTREPEEEAKEKNPHAIALGRMGGLKGGKARANKLTPEQRSEAAKKAAQARWAAKS